MTKQRTKKVKAWASVVCFFKGHLWIEWEHFSNRHRREFHVGMATLKDPECFRCRIRQSFIYSLPKKKNMKKG